MFKTTILAMTAASILAPAIAIGADGESLSGEERSVMAIIEKMTTSLQGGDVDGVMSTYEDSAIVVFEPGVTVSGRAAIRQIFSEVAAINPNVIYSGHEVFVAGDIAVHFAPWSMTAKTPDGEDLEQGGLSVAVLRRQSNGSWRMVIDNPYGDRLLNH